MTHDPMCPAQWDAHSDGVYTVITACHCDMLTSARASERDAALADAAQTVLGLWIDLYPAEGWNGALDYAAKAIERMRVPQ